MILRPFIYNPSTTKQIIEKKIKLQYSEEFLVTVSGHYCPVVPVGSPVIRSLTFRSNKRTFGPFGIEERNPIYFLNGWRLNCGLQWKKWLVPRCNWVSFISCPNNKTFPIFQRTQQSLRKLTSTASKSSATKDGEIRAQT
ncbi:jacalin-related lectin 19 [Quercus suber]|uniref:Jacalin-related lectin 19 n=1 Tax=Quercus suber TaxID=58331 RepID=A0AAW0JX36_QUESU